MGITNCPMHNNDSTQCVGLVSTNQDNFLGPHKKHLCQVWLNSQEEDENVVSHRMSMQTLTSAGGHFEFSNFQITVPYVDKVKNVKNTGVSQPR
jgi:hypothetical protein